MAVVGLEKQGTSVLAPPPPPLLLPSSGKSLRLAPPEGCAGFSAAACQAGPVAVFAPTGAAASFRSLGVAFLAGRPCFAESARVGKLPPRRSSGLSAVLDWPCSG